MFKVLFICHGNICRSPMAEYLLKDYIVRLGLADDFIIASAATSQEEIGNGVYPDVKKLLSRLGINCSDKKARQVTANDIVEFDYIIAMEQFNLDRLYALHPKIDKSKVYLLKDFSKEPGDIADPWYTRDFVTAYKEIASCLVGLIENLNQDSLLTLNEKQLKALKRIKDEI